MKSVRPVQDVSEEAGYPSVAEAQSRRDFLKKALAGATALGGLLVLPPLAWPAGLGTGHKTRQPKKKRFVVTVSLRHPYRWWSCGFEAYGMVMATSSRSLASFLAKKSESKGIEAEVVRLLSTCGCADLSDAKRLQKLHRRLGDALARYYKRRTRRRVGPPGVRLVLRRLPPRPHLRGKIKVPSAP